MIPVIALVGRPNVGKSTLFNRLTRSRDALVADFPGLTRDRQYGQGRVGGKPYILIDTGGISGDETGIDAAMARQSLLAIDEADIVLFLVDARAGLTAADESIATYLRQNGKQAHLVVNKLDGLDPDMALAEFYSLAMNAPYQIAAAHNRGVTGMISDLLEAVDSEEDDDAALLAHPEDAEQEGTEQEGTEQESDGTESDQRPARDLKIGVIGRPNVGKSTLVNRILGEERVVVFDQPGTTRDAISIPFERNGKGYTLVDTAGIRRRKNVSETAEKFSIVKTLQSIRECNVAVMVMDARTGLVEQDLHLLDFVLESGRALVLAINKWDGMTQDDKQAIKQDIERRLGFVDYADIHFISALHGTGVGNVFKSIEKAYASATTHWSTNRLTNLLIDAVAEHQPPVTQGRRIKLRYAHQGGVNPPIIVVHGNQTNRLPDNYKRYLMNTFRKVLKVRGTPMRFEFRSGENPFDPNHKDSREAAKARQLRKTKEARDERRKRR
ncbi:ribosome biogenesis GTPase Der [Terasakiispira papahanaumokuakeensis]|uniref:GTPase Der n=1 Tax=Terasakiispira papahanaumokuakeensis TaxID=197479 RepID=A0A1E2V5R2_9GAMM|nr:ribosome biogenesis GTPase Der [Terasakiispira papahanaumokuakeensis]ODC02321.1 ribosome biogenesis GTPase Der [Terasakiispira papahanaumokuakeensis]